MLMGFGEDRTTAQVFWCEMYEELLADVGSQSPQSAQPLPSTGSGRLQRRTSVKVPAATSGGGPSGRRVEVAIPPRVPSASVSSVSAVFPLGAVRSLTSDSDFGESGCFQFDREQPEGASGYLVWG